jgi:hypothetical protein
MPAVKVAKATDNTPQHSEFTFKRGKKNVQGAQLDPGSDSLVSKLLLNRPIDYRLMLKIGGTWPDFLHSK